MDTDYAPDVDPNFKYWSPILFLDFMQNSFVSGDYITYYIECSANVELRGSRMQ